MRSGILFVWFVHCWVVPVLKNVEALSIYLLLLFQMHPLSMYLTQPKNFSDGSLPTPKVFCAFLPP